MAHPDFVNISDDSIDPNSPVTTGLMQNYRQNDRALRRCVFGLGVESVSSTYTYAVNVATFKMYLPDLSDFTGIQRSLLAEFQLKVVSGGTAKLNIRDLDADVYAVEQSTASSSYVSVTCTLPFAAGLKGTVRTIQVYLWATSGTAHVFSAGRITSVLEY